MPYFCCFKISNTTLTAQTNIIDLLISIALVFASQNLPSKSLLIPIDQDQKHNLELITLILFYNNLVLIGLVLISTLFLPFKNYQKFHRAIRFVLGVPSLIISGIFSFLYGIFIFDRIDVLENNKIPIFGDIKRALFESQIKDLKVYFGIVVGMGLLAFFRFTLVSGTLNAKYKN